MSDKDKERIKSLYKLYGTAKFKINPKKFDTINGNQNSQIKSYMDIVFYNNLKTNNFGYYIISFLIITIFIFIYLREIIDEFVEHSKENWSEYKCDPRFLAYGGYIVKNENRTEFESTEDNFYECIRPITEKQLFKSFDPFSDIISGIKAGTKTGVNTIANNMDKFTGFITTITTSINDIKQHIFSLINDLNKEEDKKNKSVGYIAGDTLDLTKKLEALVKLVNQLLIGGMYTTQSVLVYIYGWFEGMLVILASIIVGIILICGIIFGICVHLGYVSIPTASFIFSLPAAANIWTMSTAGFILFWKFVLVILTLLTLFTAVCIVMLLYGQFLKVVFGINVHARKTKEPKNPFG